MRRMRAEVAVSGGRGNERTRMSRRGEGDVPNAAGVLVSSSGDPERTRRERRKGVRSERIKCGVMTRRRQRQRVRKKIRCGRVF